MVETAGQWAKRTKWWRLTGAVHCGGSPRRYAQSSTDRGLRDCPCRRRAKDSQRAAGATERIIELLKSEDLIEKPTRIKKFKFKNDTLINFNEVKFSYPLRLNDIILKGISFNLNKGDTLALVGPSGAGKSSIFQLLLRFYEFQDGSINIGGTSIKPKAYIRINNFLLWTPEINNGMALGLKE